MKKNKKGSVAIYVTFIFVAIIIVLFAAVLAPLGVRLNSEFYEVGEELMLDSNETIKEINDPEVRAQIQSSIDSALDSTQNNIDVSATIFKYGWVLIIGLTALVVFLYTRRLSEFQSGGFI